MRYLSLFSGIGGFDLGADRAGWTCIGQCEIDPFCRAVLAKHWPTVWRHDDVRTLTAEMVRENCGAVDFVIGGPPCQPSSTAGKRKGAQDERWLWGETIRLIRELGPRWFVLENPLGFMSMPDSRGVFSDLERAGYEIRPVVLGADDCGAPHRRKRVWIVGRLADAGDVGDTNGSRLAIGRGQRSDDEPEQSTAERTCDELPNADSGRLGTEIENVRWWEPDAAWFGWPARPGEPQHEWEPPRLLRFKRGLGGHINGVPVRLVRFANKCSLRAFGNAVTPECARIICEAISAAERAGGTG